MNKNNVKRILMSLRSNDTEEKIQQFESQGILLEEDAKTNSIN